MGTLTPAGYFWASLGSSLANFALLAIGGLIVVKWVRPFLSRRLGRMNGTAPVASCKACLAPMAMRAYCPTCDRCVVPGHIDLPEAKHHVSWAPNDAGFVDEP